MAIEESNQNFDKEKFPRYQPPPGYEASYNSSNSNFAAYDSSAMAYPPPVYDSFQQEQYQEAVKRAEKRLKDRIAFYQHLAAYILVNAGLWVVTAIGYITSSQLEALFMPPLVMFFWGAGLVCHAIQIFTDKESTRHKLIEEELRKTALLQ